MSQHNRVFIFYSFCTTPYFWRRATRRCEGVAGLDRRPRRLPPLAALLRRPSSQAVGRVVGGSGLQSRSRARLASPPPIMARGRLWSRPRAQAMMSAVLLLPPWLELAPTCAQVLFLDSQAALLSASLASDLVVEFFVFMFDRHNLCIMCEIFVMRRLWFYL